MKGWRGLFPAGALMTGLLSTVLGGLVPAVTAIPVIPEMPSALEPFVKKRLDNGLTVIVKEARAVPIVAIYFFVNAGSASEQPGVGGLSHFYEHMFFKGTSRSGVGEMDRLIKGMGGALNAFTTIEHTAYHVIVPSEGTWTAFELLLEAFADSIFDAGELEKERRVVLEEIGRKDDMPQDRLRTEFVSVLLRGTPYERPVLGTKETVSGIKREDMLDFRKHFCAPNNTTLVMVGDVSTETAIAKIEAATRGLLPDPGIEARKPRFEFVPQQDMRELEIPMDVQQAYILVGFPNLGRRRIEDLYVLDVASTVLGEGRSSRLVQRLREREGIAISVGAWIEGLREAGCLSVEAVCAPGNVKRVTSEVLEEVGKLAGGGITEEELARAKTMLASDFAFANETVSAMARTLGAFEMATRAEDALAYVRKINAVTAEDVKRVTRETCRPKACTIVRVVAGRNASKGKP